MSQVRQFEARSASLDFDDDTGQATLTFEGTIGGDVQTVTMSRSAFDQWMITLRERIGDDPELQRRGG